MIINWLTTGISVLISWIVLIAFATLGVYILVNAFLQVTGRKHDPVFTASEPEQNPLDPDKQGTRR